MPRYKVIRSYMVADVYYVDATDEAEAIRKAQSGEGHANTFDGDYDDEVTVELIKETTDA